MTVVLNMQQLNIGLSIFKTGHFGVESEKPSGRPVSVSVPANVKAIHDMIMEDLRISAKVLLLCGNIM